MDIKNKILEYELDDFYFTYKPEEIPDWDYARNRFFCLKRKRGTWSSSFLTAEINGYHTLNRDYPYQGLNCMINDDYYKFLDSLAFKIENNHGALNLKPKKVRISPWKIIFYYTCKEAEIKVEYFLAGNDMKNKIAGWIKFDIVSKADKTLDVKLSPLVDIREVHSRSPKIDEYQIQQKDDFLKISKDDKEIMIGNNGNEIEDIKKEIDWTYKIGDGDRKQTDNAIRFVADHRKISQLGELHYKLDKKGLKIPIVCGLNTGKTDLDIAARTTETNDFKEAAKLCTRFGMDDTKTKRFIDMRIITLNKFGIDKNGLEIPEAGEWWFKEVWFRDLYESLYQNFDIYYKLRDENWFKKIFNWSHLYIKDGVMASRPSKKEHVYNSIDATLLYLLTMSKVYHKTKDDDLKEFIEKIFIKVIDQLPGKHKLLKCKANYSWIDSKVNGRPTRIPKDWNVENDDNYLLPEVNALWLRVLDEYNHIAQANIDMIEMFKKYKDMFWNENDDYIFQLVYEKNGNMLKDDTESSVGIVSLSLLSEFFTTKEMKSAWKHVIKNLIVHRKPIFYDYKNIPFGVVTKNMKEKIFYDDNQYHGSTIWLRDNPYLCNLLEKMGKDELSKKIKINMLDHQMSEAGIFYNQELFALPIGKNPTPYKYSMNPVPVKNPIQLWSQWIPKM